MSVASESVPVVLSLVSAITQIVNARDDRVAQLDALNTAAEAVKRRLDELKFAGERDDA
jgi:hypothetical protein